ncbi:PE-PGRS protein, putative [Trichomonas vaginalis G3]|uniref:receptor protein-tyrosine kinase n=2 Tax=Trichomonas vaginalis (strain ATCC PRA-98 / G3) TaxID=412133 RepID=A2ERB9_TRIV3|nr:PE-PGRS protein, putative [Trichomonas vaginalis G3]|eukprot:XP_001317018.1 PE-PGRS protein [Trichomonas vaginalis G3]
MSENGGAGGYSKGILTLKNETRGFLYIGGKGTAIKTSGKQMGGFNGGGYRYYYDYNYYGAGGGGASDIRLEKDSFTTRIIVAGGGGGSGHGTSADPSASETTHNGGGSGGGYKGGDGTLRPSSTSVAYGGTQINPGDGEKYDYRSKAIFGNGGSYTCTSCSTPGSGGGGGWYGGAASGCCGYSAAGGSGYVLTSTSYKPNEYVYKREYFLMKASMKSGIRYGNGAIKITILDNVDIENVKIQGCGLTGVSYSRIASLITSPSVA